MKTQERDRILDEEFENWLDPSAPLADQPMTLPEAWPFEIEEQDVDSFSRRPAPDPARQWLVQNMPIDTASSARAIKSYVNGRDYCADLYRSLVGARRHIYLTGLHFMHDFGLIRTASRNVKLVDVLRAKAHDGVRIRLLVNLFWPQEGTMIGEWKGSRFEYFNSPKTRQGGSMRTMRELAAAWPFPSGNLETAVKAAIGAKGQLERYFPATIQLFRKLNIDNVKCRLDVHPGHIMHSHHQKTVVIDDRVAYVGGIDLTHVDGDRWDTAAHRGSHRHTNRAEKYWHDVHGRVEGDMAVRVSHNFKSRWRSGELYYIPAAAFRGSPRSVTLRRDPTSRSEFRQPPAHHSTSRHPTFTAADIRRRQRPIVQIVRSMPFLPPVARQRRRYNIPPRARWDRAAKDAYLTGIAAAHESIYLENQWVSDEDLWDGLTASAASNHRSDYRVVLMMPNEPLRAAGAGANQDIFVEINLLRLLIAAHNSQTVSAFSLVKPSDNKQIYVHSKIMLVDDAWTLIGSANAGGISLEGVRDFPTFLRILRAARSRGRITLRDLRRIWRIFAGRGERPDTELSFITLHGAFTHSLRTQLWTEHLYGSGQRLTGRLTDDVQTMRRVADNGGHRLRNHPYLVTAFRYDQFPGIDLRIFGYSTTDIIRALGQLAVGATPAGAVNVLQELRKIPAMLAAIAQELQQQGNAAQRRGWQFVQASLGPYLDTLAARSPVARDEFQQMRSHLNQLASGRAGPNS